MRRSKRGSNWQAANEKALPFRMKIVEAIEKQKQAVKS